MHLRRLGHRREGVHRQRFERYQRHAQLARLATALALPVCAGGVISRSLRLGHHRAVCVHARMPIAGAHGNGCRLAGGHLRTHVLRAPTTQGQENDQEEDEKSAHGRDDSNTVGSAMMLGMTLTPTSPVSSQPDSRQAVLRLLVTLALMTVGASGMYVVPVVLSAVQAEFAVTRADAALPYTLLMIGFGVGGLFMGRLADRRGVMLPLLIGALGLGVGFVAAAQAHSIWTFTLVHGLLMGLLGCAVTFAPLLADTSMWFVKHRGMAVAVCASGNYLGGAIWPPIVQHFVEAVGWRQTYMGMGVFCGLSMAGLALLMRAKPPAVFATPGTGSVTHPLLAHALTTRPFGLRPGRAQLLLCVAGVSCCVAMAMPQVHIVAYCSDLGFGAARGAEMLSLMLACGIASRLISGFICDRIGGLRTLLLGSTLQGIALLLFLPFDGLVSLYVVAALFGLFQGGIVPSYAIIVREYFPASEAGARIGAIIMATLLGMALGGWMSGKVFDLTGSYQAAFLNGIAWAVLNIGIAVFLLSRVKRRL
jgi:MFS family permease